MNWYNLHEAEGQFLKLPAAFRDGEERVFSASSNSTYREKVVLRCSPICEDKRIIDLMLPRSYQELLDVTTYHVARCTYQGVAPTKVTTGVTNLQLTCVYISTCTMGTIFYLYRDSGDIKNWLI